MGIIRVDCRDPCLQHHALSYRRDYASLADYIIVGRHRRRVTPSNPGSHRRITGSNKESDMKTSHNIPDPLTQARLAAIASLQGWPCLSLYQPTH